MMPFRPIVAALVVLGLFAGPAVAVPTDSVTVSEESDAAGPPSDLPAPVPDFVEDILGSIIEFLAGLSDGPPGENVSETASGASPAENPAP